MRLGRTPGLGESNRFDTLFCSERISEPMKFLNLIQFETTEFGCSQSVSGQVYRIVSTLNLSFSH